MTKLGCPVAHPRLRNRPSPKHHHTMTVGKAPFVILRLDIDTLDTGMAFSPAISISLSKCPMLPTIAFLSSKPCVQR
ncbi:MAG: hypothetical protein CM1200mP25_1040 [Acidobacteriota bacterium]|nr:MAG: hypothetical protein CM1200mP25_1040 [Acidobacteriota bacterium]